MQLWTLNHQKMALILTAVCITVNVAEGPVAFAKKKAAAPAAPTAPAPDPVAIAEAKLAKDIAPLNTQLTQLMEKIQGRYLLSPSEAGQLVDLKYKLLDFLNDNPQSMQLSKPLYQAGVLFTQREEYNDAYEMFNYLAQGFPSSQYGIKAKGQMMQLEKKFGANYFAVESAVPAASTTASVTPTAPAPAAKTPSPKK